MSSLPSTSYRPQIDLCQSTQPGVVDTSQRSRPANSYACKTGPELTPAGLVVTLTRLVEAGVADLPRPGAGRTFERFCAFADIAATSLPLVKLFEAHADAQAILAELAPQVDRDGVWGVFAAEPGPARLFTFNLGGDDVLVSGDKPWCSGGAGLNHALVTARGEDDERLLVAVALDAPGVSASLNDWKAVGMASTQTCTLHFDEVPGIVVGRNNQYIERPGFWQGAIGVAACWYGGAQALASRLSTTLARGGNDHAFAHLGAVSASLWAAQTALFSAAAEIDRNPQQNCMALALRTRAVVEKACQEVLDHVGRALGAGPFCNDAAFAAMAADLPVFLRQSHAERDLATLGHALIALDQSWMSLSHNA